MRKSKCLAIALAVVIISIVGLIMSRTTRVTFFDENVDALTQNEGATGTCCKSVDCICVVGNICFEGYYYLPEGPCIEYD